MDEALELVGKYWHLVPTVIAVASVIVRLTPTKTDDKVLAVVAKVVETIALNNKPVELKNEKNRT